MVMLRLIVFLLSVLLFSCKKDDPGPPAYLLDYVGEYGCELKNRFHDESKAPLIIDTIYYSTEVVSVTLASDSSELVIFGDEVGVNESGYYYGYHTSTNSFDMEIQFFSEDSLSISYMHGGNVIYNIYDYRGKKQ